MRAYARETPAARTDLGRDFTVCDAADALEIVRLAVERTLGREIDGRSAQILLDFIGLVKDAMLEEPARSHAEAAAAVFVSRREQVERICVDEQRRYDEKFFRFLAKYGASVARLYDQTLLENNTLDFSDLLIRAAALLRDRQTAQLWTGPLSLCACRRSAGCQPCGIQPALPSVQRRGHTVLRRLQPDNLRLARLRPCRARRAF